VTGWRYWKNIFSDAIKIAHGIVTIYVVNTLDQTVTIQVKGNRTESTTNASEVGSLMVNQTSGR
jgi:hypothetical protein